MILISGCSFTSEYSDYNTWSTYLTEKIKDVDTVRNVSAGGSSNKLISRRVFWHLNNNFNAKKYDYAIIQWSTIDRWDYPTTNHDDSDSTDLIRYCPYGSNIGGKKSRFYKHYYSVYGAVIDTLENILFIQQLLNSENIPYTMITIGNLFTLSTTINKIKNLMESGGDYYELRENVLEKMEKVHTNFEDTDSINTLLKKINYNKFVFSDDERNPLGGGMLEWLYKEKNEYPKNNWHFNGNQSYDFFNEFVKPKILIPNGLI